jgi:hypothetical protein
MKNIKDITISIFAIIGFVTILSSFNNQSQETHSTVPESHVWEMWGESSYQYIYNKVTGEIKAATKNHSGVYITLKEK